MELLEGHTLADEIKLRRIEPDRAVDYATAISKGLGAAHAKGIQHRDLKPANVMIHPNGQVKIFDFGLARWTEPLGSDATEVRHTLVGHVAPERIRGELGDERADVFAVGVILHEMLTGQNPFARDSIAETVTAILRDTPEAPG